MAAKYILAGLAAVFVVAGTIRRAQMQGRIWLVVGGIFAVVSSWLFLSAP